MIRIPLSLALATVACGPVLEDGSQGHGATAGEGEPSDDAPTACSARLQPGAPAAIRGYCPTRAYRSPFAGPTVAPSTATLVDSTAGTLAVDAAGRRYAVVDPEPTEFVFLPRGLVAVDPDGSEAWRNVVDGYLAGTPTLAEDGTLLSFITLDTSQLALAEIAPSGDVATFEIPRGSRPNPAVGEDGTLYFARQGSEEEPFGGAFAMAPDRSIAWRFETPGMRATMIAVGPGDRVLIGVDRELVDLTADGVELRRRELPGTIAAGPAIADDGAVYVATQGGSPDYAHALHVIAADGTTRFETRLNGLPLPDVPLAVARDGGALVATLATLTFFERDGSIRWERSLDSGPTDVGFDCSIDANGLVVVAHGDLFALRSEDGEEVWRIAPTSARPGTPCVDSVTIGGAGQIYAGECGGRLFEISGS